MWEIKGKNNVVKAIPSTKPEYNGVWMEECYVTVNVESPTPVNFEIGDYLIYRGERFEINYDPGKIKYTPQFVKGDAFKYENIKFNSLADELTRCDFLDVVLEDNQLHFTGLPKFSFYGGVQDLANRIQANLDRAYPNQWTVIVSPEYSDTKEVNISVDTIKVQGALSILVNDLKAYYTIKGRTITIGAAGIPAGHLFKYGKGNGLYEIEQNAEADQAIVTRLRAYGSSRNLPHRYYHNLPNIDRAHADIHTVLSKSHGTIGPNDTMTFVFLGSYVDTSKCYAYTPESGMTSYWFTVTINNKTYAAMCDASKSPQQITIGIKPPKGYSGSANWVLRRTDMNDINAGTSVAFDCYTSTAPGIVEGQHVPNNMAVNFLMLPGFPETTLDPYIDSANIDASGVREGTVFFDGSQEGLEEIYPSIEGMTAEQLIAAGVPCNSTGALDMIVSAEQMTDNGIGKIEGNKSEAEPATFKITLKDLGFDINDHLTSETATVSFKTGMLGGRDFEIVGCVEIKDSYDKVTGYEVELNRVYDDDIKLWFPYSAYNAKPGDKFVLLHIEMPEVYIKAASHRLLEAATAWLAKNDYSRSVYAPKVDEIFMARQHDAAVASGGSIASLHDTLKEGMMLLFEDDDLNIDASIFIDRLTIKEEGKIPTYEVVLKEEKTVGRLDKMQNQIDSLAGGGQGSGYTAAQIRSIIDAYGGERFLNKLKDDRSTGKVASDIGFEAGNFTSGVSGGMLGIDKTDGSSFAEVDDMRVRRKVYFETLTTMEATTLAGKHYITPGGSIRCVRVEEVKDTDGDVTAYRCWFLSEQSGEKTNTKIIKGDQCISEMFNAKTGTANKVSNHRYWRLVTGVSNDAHTDDAGNHYGYIDLSVTDCEPDSDIPQEDDVLVQFGNRTDVSRQGAIVLSAVEFDAPAIKMLAGIGSGDTTAEHYTLDGKDITAQGYNHAKGHAYMKVYGDTYIGAKDKSTYLNFDQDTKSLDIKAVVNILGGSTIDGELTLSSLIRVGYKQDGVLFKTMAGMNGSWVPELGGRTIAAWYGGPMVDLFDKNGNRLNLVAGTYAASLDRMDGSGYKANGNFRWKEDGTVNIGDETYGITLGSDGRIVLGNGISINIGGNAQGLGQSIASVTNLTNKLSNLFTPYIGTSAKNWSEITDIAQITSVKINAGAWTDSFMSARGLNPNGGGSGTGGKSYLSDLLDVDLDTLSSGQVLTWNGTKWVNSALTLPDMAGYALESWVEANFQPKGDYLTTEAASTAFVSKAGDSMTGALNIGNSEQTQIWLNSSGIKAGIGLKVDGATFGWVGYDTYHGTVLYTYDGGHYLGIYPNGTPRFDGNVIWHQGNDGSGSGLDADMLDGKHLEQILRFASQPPTSTSLNDRTVSKGIDFFSWALDTSSNVNGQPHGDGASSAASVVTFGVSYPFQLYSDYNDTNHLYYRSYYGYTGWKAWRQFAFVDSNVASATKLQTARTIWGQPFDGTGDVSGTLSDVEQIQMSGGIISGGSSQGAYIGHAGARLGSTYTGGLLYAYGNNPLYFYTNNSQRMMINGKGNVGIGMDSSAYKLDVNGAIRTTALVIGDCTISWNSTNKMLHVDRGLYSNGPVSARGVNARGVNASGRTGSGTGMDVNASNATYLAMPNLVAQVDESYDLFPYDSDYFVVGDSSYGYDYCAKFKMTALWRYIKDKADKQYVPTGGNLIASFDGDNVALSCQPGTLRINGKCAINSGGVISSVGANIGGSVSAYGFILTGPAPHIDITYQGKTYTLQLAKLIEDGYLA